MKNTPSLSSLIQQSATNLLLALVQTPSVSFQEQEIAHVLEQKAQALGLKTHIDEAGNFVGEIGEGSKEIVFLGHMDTVPGGPVVRIENDILYGRGSVDAKGSLATFIMAIHLIQQDPSWKALAKDWKLSVIGAVEEEAATSKGARFIKDLYHPAYCIIGEPSHWQGLTLGYKGRLLMHYRALEATSHSAGPGWGIADNAIQFWEAIKTLATRDQTEPLKIFEQLQPRLREMHTSILDQQEVVDMVCGFRIPPTLTVAQLKTELLAIPHTGIIDFYGEEEPFVASRRQPLIPAFMNAIEAQGGQGSVKYKTGTSDMNVVGPHWKCPILAYGPGDSALDHTPDEHLELSEYFKAIRILKEALIFILKL